MKKWSLRNNRKIKMVSKNEKIVKEENSFKGDIDDYIYGLSWFCDNKKVSER